MNSLKLKLVLIITLATVTILVSVSCLNYNRAAKILMDELTATAASSAEYNVKIMDEWLTGLANEVNAAAENPYIQNMEPDRYMPVLKNMIAKNTDYELAFVADRQGDGGGSNDTTFNISTRAYFSEVMQGKVAISEPVVSRATGNAVIVVAAPTYQEHATSPTGLVGVSVTVKFLQELVKDMQINGRGYGYIQGPDGLTIVHPNDEYTCNNKIYELADSDLREIIHKMNRGETGYGFYTFEGEKSITSYAPAKSVNWSIAQAALVDEFTQPLVGLRNTNIVVTLLAVLIMFGVAIIIAGFISNPLVKMSRVAEGIADGDLTQKLDFGRTSKDELGVLAGSFKTMVENLKLLIKDIQNNASGLASNSLILASSSEEVSATLEEVASTTNQVASISARGAEKASAAVRESELVQQVAGDGNRAVKETIEKMSSIASTSENASHAVQKLGEQSKQIGEIINTITNIAEQTNLLALNAAIEAARAGEQGRGFAVVAEEVRKLAEQSAGAAKQIVGLIKEIQAGVKDAVNAMSKGTAEVNEGVKIADNAGITLSQISSVVERNTAIINEVAIGIKQSDEGTQQLTIANEQITSTMQEVSGAAQELANIANELQVLVGKFKIN